jgi:hypothetical protein
MYVHINLAYPIIDAQRGGGEVEGGVGGEI